MSSSPDGRAAQAAFALAAADDDAEVVAGAREDWVETVGLVTLSRSCAKLLVLWAIRSETDVGAEDVPAVVADVASRCRTRLAALTS